MKVLIAYLKKHINNKKLSRKLSAIYERIPIPCKKRFSWNFEATKVS